MRLLAWSRMGYTCWSCICIFFFWTFRESFFKWIFSFITSWKIKQPDWFFRFLLPLGKISFPPIFDPNFQDVLGTWDRFPHPGPDWGLCHMNQVLSYAGFFQLDSHVRWVKEVNRNKYTKSCGFEHGENESYLQARTALFQSSYMTKEIF